MIDARFKQHLPPYSDTDLEDMFGDSTLRMTNGAVKVSAFGDHDYYYLGTKIAYDSSSVYSKFRVGGEHRGESFATLRDTISYIDTKRNSTK